MDESLEIKLYSLNVRGLANSTKRRCVFSWLRKQPFSLYLLQETHSTKNCESIWTSEWGNKIYFSHGKSDSAGVCVLLSVNCGLEILEVHRDSEGRLLLLNLSYGGCKFTIVNLYGPNKDDVNTFQNLHVLLNDYGEEPMVIGGDFNTIQDPLIDRYPTHVQYHPHCYDAIETLKSDFDLVDIWRNRNPNKLQFTWRSNMSRSRIDYLLLSSNICNYVEECNILYGHRSDHSAITLTVIKKVPKRGPGFWKMNTSLLLHECNRQEIRKVIRSTIESHPDMNVCNLWEYVKYSVKQKCIELSSKVRKDLKDNFQLLSKSIERLQTEFDKNPDDKDLEKSLLNKKTELTKIQEEFVRGSMIRTRASWIGDGEKNTKYFFNLEKRNYNKKNIQKLQNNDQLISDPTEILNLEREFYENLYTSHKVEEKDIEEVFLNLPMPKLNEEHANLCEGFVSEKECFEAIQTIPCDKTPGCDGLPMNFYKVFWEDIKALLRKAFNLCFVNGELSTLMKRGVITLLPKKDKDKLHLKNWRPITLLNNDYKILAKVLANRLKKVLPFLIDFDQTGFLKNRYIGENIRLLKDVIRYCHIKSFKGLVVLADFEKAFDNIEWNFLNACLKAFGFKRDFIAWFKVMYKDISSCVINNGYSSSNFSLQKGVRQGCPLSPYLFLIGVEILGIMIRQSEKIKGIEIDGAELRVSQYADDTIIYLSADEGNLRNTFEILQSFRKISGMKVNIEKSNIACLGPWNGTLCTDIHLNWVTDSLFYLGVYVPLHENVDCFNQNFQRKLREVEKLLQVWGCRNLTLFGKIVIIKSLVIPKFVYLFSNIQDPPKRFTDELQRLLFNFLWNGKTDRIRRITMYDEYKNGGLKMMHIQSFCQALKVSWVKRLLDEEGTGVKKWKLFANFFLNKCGGNLIFKGNFRAQDCTSLTSNIFWVDVLKAWSHYKYYNPVRYKDMTSQFLWNNSFIKIADRIVFYKRWSNAGINYVRDLLKNNGYFKSFEEIRAEFNIPTSSYLEYFAIASAIPAEWKIVLKQTNANEQVDPIDKQLDVFVSQKYPVKFCYAQMLKNVCSTDSSHNLIRWETDLQQPLERLIVWRNRFTVSFSATLDTKIRTFQFKFLHRRIATNHFLCKIGIKPSPICNLCNNAEQTLLHLFFYCEKVHSFWQKVNQWFESIALLFSPLTCLDICFGIDTKKTLINTVILYAKQFIFRCKCLDKAVCFEHFKKELVYLEKVERVIAFRKDKLTFHETKWGLLA